MREDNPTYRQKDEKKKNQSENSLCQLKRVKYHLLSFDIKKVVSITSLRPIYSLPFSVSISNFENCGFFLPQD